MENRAVVPNAQRIAADAEIALGHAAEDHGDPALALRHYRSALDILPGHAPALLNIGNALRAVVDEVGAEAAYRQAIANDGAYAPAHYNLGRLLADRGAHSDAERAYRAALAIAPNMAQAHLSLADLLETTGRAPEAESQLQALVAIEPGHAGAWTNLALLCLPRQRYDEAILALTRALAADPGSAGACAAMGNVLLHSGRARESEAYFRRSLQLDPAAPRTYSQYLFSLNSRDDLAPQAIADAHAEFSRTFESLPPVARAATPQTPGTRLRIGYVSGDWLRHPVGMFMRPVLTHHDRANFEVHCYSSNRRDDDVTAVLRQRCEHWHDVAGLDDQALAERVAADRIDVLVDLAGHSGTHRLGVFMRRAAPVQCTWLGNLNTTGMRAMDYRLCDAVTDPPGQTERFHSEQLWRLPDSQWCYDPYHVAPAPERAARGPDASVVFGSFNHLSKISDTTLDRWCLILGALPASRLAVYALPRGDARARFVSRIVARGIPVERVDLFDRMTIDEYFRSFAHVDIGLDTMPYNGATTTLDTLFMGVPIVGLAGASSVARGTASILTTLGIPEWVTTTVEAYVECNLRLARDPGLRAQSRHTLRERLQRSPLMDGPRFARSLENAYREMVRRRVG